jgi:hypothetical protein
MEKRIQKETTLMRSPKPNWIGVNRNQHKLVTEKKDNNVTENKNKLKSIVKCPKTSNKEVVRDAWAHESEREPEDQQRRWVEVERHKRGLTCRHMLNTHWNVVIGLADHGWQVKEKTARNPEEWLVCIQDFLKSREHILKKPYPKISRKKLNLDFERLNGDGRRFYDG